MNRVNNIKEKLSTSDIDAIFITSPYNVSYLTNLFPSSIEEREYYLLITKKNAYLLAPKMFMMAIKQKTDNFIYLEITGDKGLFENILEVTKKENIKSLGFEDRNILYKEFEHLEDSLEETELVSLEDFIEDERQLKDIDEIEKIKKACEITDKCFEEILNKIKLGITEREIASEIEFFFNKTGRNAFTPIVAFGKNASVPHHIPDDTKLTNNSFVLFDFGSKFEGYCSDMSRTIYFGTPNENEIKLYNTVLESQMMALEKLKEWKDENFQTSHMHSIAESHIKKNSFESFPHALGHGLGLEVHELPGVSKYSEGNELRAGMIITVEPGIYDPNIGGVRIEDDVLLTPTGYEILTKSPKELIVIK